MGIIAPINAIYSWEGYKYQGNIALYVTLFLIKKCVFESKSLDGYELQIEGEEDFAILENGNYRSLHQVKLGHFNLNDNDKFVFIAELIQNNANYGYFHVNKKKKIPEDFLDTALSYISSLIAEFKQKKVVSKNELTNLDKEEDFIILESINKIHKKGTIYSLIKYVTNGCFDKESVENAVKYCVEELKHYKDVIESKKKVFLDSHPDEIVDKCFLDECSLKFDNINEVKRESLQIIQDIINFKNPSMQFADSIYCEFLYDHAINLIEQYVTDYFIQSSNDGKCLIPFRKFFDLLFEDYFKYYNTVAYKYYYFEKKINERFAEYKMNNCMQDDCNKCNKFSECNLGKQFNIMSHSDVKSKNQIMFNLLLQKPTFSINNLPNDETIDDQLIELIHDLSALSLNSKNVISASLNSEFYWLSLDDSKKMETLSQNIIKGIEENPDKSFLYECDTLITGRFKRE